MKFTEYQLEQMRLMSEHWDGMALYSTKRPELDVLVEKGFLTWRPVLREGLPVISAYFLAKIPKSVKYLFELEPQSE